MINRLVNALKCINDTVYSNSLKIDSLNCAKNFLLTSGRHLPQNQTDYAVD